ncbi:MAG TPA: hypothetical protein IAC82_09075 [Candidatus Merdivicinus intestinigallinarum]|nr:hypothetical protein [Candidatus Merdivicinus intestinigallinarum]
MMPINDSHAKKESVYGFLRIITTVVLIVCLLLVFAVCVAFSRGPLETEQSRSENFWLGVLCGAGAVVSGGVRLWIGWQDRRLKQEFSQERQDFLEKLRSEPLPEIPAQGVLLAENEKCYWQCPAGYTEIKTITTGYRHQSTGMSVRVAKGMRLHASSGTSTAIKKNVMRRYPGRFTVTDRRLIFESSKGGFDKPFEKITSISPHTNGIVLQSGGKQFSVGVGDPQVVYTIIQKVMTK